ncbi:M13 family metallopeptidase [Novosphingobium flavum]|uniref:M13 family metallopeptidase n=1 Tax=Novosphingobium flavum TaxID=1778672 RepID=A0A7X1KKN9_9SPHN|nr:M13 family metallopeptidase [Novosphingobium flavum]MBC2664754.1 M13 family metallopeptidase [Novosphingobium flavum]
MNQARRSLKPGPGIFTALLLALAIPVLGPAGCTAGEDEDAARNPGTGLGIDAAAMDKTVKPGDDFYGYANGSWLRSAKIPDDKAQFGAFTEAELETSKQLGKLIDDILKGDAAPDSNPGRIRAYYSAYLDTARIEAAGMEPARADLARFAAVNDVAGLSRVLGQQVRADVDPFNATDFFTENLFGLFVTRALDGDLQVPYLLQGGLGLPEREYYLSSAPKMAEIRQKYRAYIETVLAAAGLPDAAQRAERVYGLEMKIAAAHATREQSEDFTRPLPEWAPAEFAKKAPGIDWGTFFAAAGVAGPGKITAYHPQAIARLSALVAKEPLDAWKDWLVFHQLNGNADVLPARIDAAHFAFYGKVLRGIAKEQPRQRRALDAVNDALGDALGKLYVEQYFPASAKREIEGMVAGIKGAFERRIGALDWMAPETRSQAIEKVRTMEVGVGYPETWKDYSAFAVLPNEAYANKVAAGRVRLAQQLGKVGKPLDPREWWMNAQLVNAVNLPLQNALNFPAAILQRPFFDAKADPAFNYGAIGAVIGHEISHSFDNNGAGFDARGRLRNWWTAADLAKFNRAGAALADQYDRYRPFPDLHVNGKLTLGENIADVAGLAAAWDAYRASLKGKEPPVIDGFTGDQRFFIAYAQSWGTKYREEALRGRIATDGHAPGQYRAQTVRNVDAWYRAFDVQPGDKLYLAPEKRVQVW